MDAVVTDKKGRPLSSIVSIVVAVLTLGYMLPWMVAALRGKLGRRACPTNFCRPSKLCRGL